MTGNGFRRLVVVRHARSTWNASDRFTGWVDVGLAPSGVLEARRCGIQLNAAGMRPDVVHTSALRRSIRTAHLIQRLTGRPGVPRHASLRLNERHYGALQGLDRAWAESMYGADVVARWRRSLDGRPPSIGDGISGAADEKYDHDLATPGSETFADVLERVRRYWSKPLSEDLRRHATVLVVAHGASIRALNMCVLGLSPIEALSYEVGTAVPTVYEWDDFEPALPPSRVTGVPTGGSAASVL